MAIHKSNTIRRVIPAKAWYLNDTIVVILASGLIFSGFVVEFDYVLTSVWRSWIYGIFGILSISVILHFFSVGVMSILVTFVNLHHYDWNWWWRSYLIGFLNSLFMFAYCVYKCVFVFRIDFGSSEIVYYLFCLLGGLMFGLMSGSVSLITSFGFLTWLYGGSESKSKLFKALT